MFTPPSRSLIEYLRRFHSSARYDISVRQWFSNMENCNISFCCFHTKDNCSNYLFLQANQSIWSRKNTSFDFCTLNSIINCICHSNTIFTKLFDGKSLAESTNHYRRVSLIRNLYSRVSDLDKYILDSESFRIRTIFYWNQPKTSKEKCNLTLAMSPTCHSNNTLFICWHLFFLECSQQQIVPEFEV